MSYFWDFKPIGLNANIERHREKEKELLGRIKELEEIENPTDFDVRCAQVYRDFLGKLWESKAQILEKLGRK